MKQKFINWSKTGEAKAKYGADAVVIDQETKFGIQTKLFLDKGGELKYERQFNGGDRPDDIVPEDLTKDNEIDERQQEAIEDLQEEQLSDMEQQVAAARYPLYFDPKMVKNESSYLDLSFGKIVNGKGSFLKGLAKTTGLKFAYEVEKAMNKTKIPLGTVATLSGLRPAIFELREDLRELGIEPMQLRGRKGLQNALSTLRRKGEFKELQRLMKFNLDFEKKGGKTLLKLLKIKDPRVLNNELNKKGLGKKETKALVGGILFKRKIKGKKFK